MFQNSHKVSFGNSADCLIGSGQFGSPNCYIIQTVKSQQTFSKHSIWSGRHLFLHRLIDDKRVNQTKNVTDSYDFGVCIIYSDPVFAKLIRYCALVTFIPQKTQTAF